MSEQEQAYKKQLIDRYIAGSATEEELMAFFGLVNQDQLNELLENHMDQEIEAIRRESPVLIRRSPKWRRIAVAASILLGLTLGGYFIIHKQTFRQVALLKPGTFKNDVLPGNKAMLTLANGQKIAVSNAGPGLIARQGLTNIRKSNDGNLLYQALQNGNAALNVSYNTFTTLRGGGKHSLQLADGTIAVLDAGSSITFPVAFKGHERQVEITGQVYFEVVHNAQMPFSVKVKNQVIRDLGTHFNINAFDDEAAIKTTLIEGSISVSSGRNKGYTLKPGQQAVAAPDGNIVIKNNVDLGVVIAWKNDLFKFDSHTSLPAVMLQLSRWYDLDVVYQGEKKHYNFGGDIPRTSKLSDVLKILEYSGVKFAVDGKKIIVFQ